jgi:hypothetical protein
MIQNRQDLIRFKMAHATLLVTFLFILLPAICVEKMVPDENRLRYGSFGIGYGTGTFVTGGYTSIWNHIGMSVSTKGLWYSADLPSDYTGFFTNDNVFMISMMAVYQGSEDETTNTCVGVELGPSFINYRREVEIRNPNYGSGWVIDNYLRDNVIINTIGLSSRVTFDWMFSSYWGLELALFGNINRFKSSIGIEFNILFGKLK